MKRKIIAYKNYYSDFMSKLAEQERKKIQKENSKDSKV